MKIALINEDSQADKNGLIYSVLKEEAEKKGHTVQNYGMYSEKDEHEINYIQLGVIASILLASEAVDFVVTGCGTGQGASMSCNAFSNITCGYVNTPLDAYLFTQVNAGNAISMPFGQGFGWGAEINLRYVFEKLFAQEFGGGYPEIYAEGEARSRKAMYTNIKFASQYPVLEAYKNMDREYLKSILDYKEFKELFFANAKDNEVTEYIKSLFD